jgi:K(+)-stimulated pyrophosphate-energized sodium pump
MENILTNMSIGGAILVLLTTLKMMLQKSLLHKTTKTTLVIHTALQKAHLFMQQAYKPFTLFILSGFILFVCYRVTGDRYMAIWVSSVIGGIVSIGLSTMLKSGMAWVTTGVTHNHKSKAIHIILDEKHISNGGALFISLTSLLLVVMNYQSDYDWSTFTVLSLAASFTVGASGLLLCIHLHECFTSRLMPGASMHASNSTKILSNDRFDALMGTLVAAMLLGTTMSEITSFQRMQVLASPVILPLFLAVSGVGISSVAAMLAKINGWKKDPVAYLTEKMVSALLMIMASFIITQYMLPPFWVCNGTEYTSMQVFYAAQAGIIGGLLTNKVIQGYYALHRKYFSYLAKKPFRITSMDTVFHFFINTLSTFLPVILILLSILFSYKLVGLYGIVIALVAMLANISTQLTNSK